MEVIDIKELPDGGADLTVDVTEEESKLLIGYAIKHLLAEYLEKEKLTKKGK